MTQFIIGIIAFSIYLLPAILATWKRHPNVVIIWLINVFLGWTLIGWIVALIWSLKAHKPTHEKPGNRNGVLITFAVIGGFSLIGALAPKTAPTSTNLSSTETTSSSSISASSSSLLSSSASSSQSLQASTTGHWNYFESQDKMRGTTTKYASLNSDNELTLGFPYKGGTTTLTLRKGPSGTDTYIEVNGQFLCDDYSHTTVAVKFDDGPIQRYGCSEPSDASTGILFIRNEAKFITQLKNSKHMIIETEMFQEGRQQIEFSSEGLVF